MIIYKLTLKFFAFISHFFKKCIESKIKKINIEINKHSDKIEEINEITKDVDKVFLNNGDGTTIKSEEISDFLTKLDKNEYFLYKRKINDEKDEIKKCEKLIPEYKKYLDYFNKIENVVITDADLIKYLKKNKDKIQQTAKIK